MVDGAVVEVTESADLNVGKNVVTVDVSHLAVLFLLGLQGLDINFLRLTLGSKLAETPKTAEATKRLFNTIHQPGEAFSTSLRKTETTHD